MPVESGGEVTSWSSVDGFAHAGPGTHPLGKFLTDWAAYDRIYETMLWPSVAVNKLVALQVQLPRKVYRRAPRGREDGRDSPFGQLIARPSPVINPQVFWAWLALMYQIHGRSFAKKVRDRGGRPVELNPIHPTRMRYGPEGGGHVLGGHVPAGENRWWYRRSDMTEVEVARRDLLYWARPSAKSPLEGMSPFEPLRDTLENEAMARRANSAMWRNGNKPAFTLTHPGKFNNPKVTQALAEQFEARHGGVDQWGKPLVLQEGMQAVPLNLTNKEMQYIEARQINREEVAAALDIPPPAIGILDRATYSNIREQNEMLYRQTMPIHLNGLEAAIEFDLRDGRFGEDREPDFGEAFYFEHLIDGVLRGAFEDRIAALAQGVQNGLLTPAEARDMDNRPFIEGSDVLFVNGAVVPVAQAAAGQGATGAAGPAQAALPEATVSTVMGRLSRPATLDEVDEDQLVAGLDDAAAGAVRGAVAIARYGECSVAELRQIVKKIGVG